MKTIKDAAVDYAEDVKDTTNGMFYADCQDAFKTGVEFAQQWISVNEQLPSEDNELIFVPVIAITGYGNYRITVYDGFNWTSDEIVTFWRPIELK